MSPNHLKRAVVLSVLAAAIALSIVHFYRAVPCSVVLEFLFDHDLSLNLERVIVSIHDEHEADGPPLTVSVFDINGAALKDDMIRYPVSLGIGTYLIEIELVVRNTAAPIRFTRNTSIRESSTISLSFP